MKNKTKHNWDGTKRVKWWTCFCHYTHTHVSYERHATELEPLFHRKDVVLQVRRADCQHRQRQGQTFRNRDGNWLSSLCQWSIINSWFIWLYNSTCVGRLEAAPNWEVTEMSERLERTEKLGRYSPTMFFITDEFVILLNSVITEPVSSTHLTWNINNP
jgi:hypothetical protein